jgi:hypothetical protein
MAEAAKLRFHSRVGTKAEGKTIRFVVSQYALDRSPRTGAIPQKTQ